MNGSESIFKALLRSMVSGCRAAAPAFLAIIFVCLAISASSAKTANGDEDSSHEKTQSVQIYFATTRLNRGSEKSPAYSGDRHLDFGSGAVEYGTVGLHTPEELKSPASAANGRDYKRLLRKDADIWRKADFTFVSKSSEDDFFKRVRDWPGQICVYIHGYDKPFLESVQDAAMLFADYQQYETSPKKKLLLILFSWPSIGGRTEYGTDEANLEWSSFYFDRLLSRVIQEKSPDSQLDIVAHSMGVRPVVWYLSSKFFAADKPIFGNLFLCAGDADFHSMELKKKLLEDAVSDRVYIFVSDRDKPLILSHLLHQQPRIGRPIDSPKFTRQRNQIFSSAYLEQLTTDTSDLLSFTDFTESPDVKRWLQENHSLDQEYGKKSRLVDVTDLITKDFGHGAPFSVIASYMAGRQSIPQLKEQVVHKRPDRATLLQTGGKPPYLYRFRRLEPLNSY